MANEQLNQQVTPQNVQQPNTKILDQTFGEVLQNNPQAQQMIMRSMGIDEQQFQQMLGAAANNPMMHQTIGNLFKSGFFQQGQAMQLNPQQFQQMMGQLQQGNAQGQGVEPIAVMPVQMNGEAVQQENLVLQPGQLQPPNTTSPQQAQKRSFFDTVKGWFR